LRHSVLRKIFAAARATPFSSPVGAAYFCFWGAHASGVPFSASRRKPRPTKTKIEMFIASFGRDAQTRTRDARAPRIPTECKSISPRLAIRAGRRGTPTLENRPQNSSTLKELNQIHRRTHFNREPRERLPPLVWADLRLFTKSLLRRQSSLCESC
jgi:hypothetical protein